MLERTIADIAYISGMHFVIAKEALNNDHFLEDSELKSMHKEWLEREADEAGWNTIGGLILSWARSKNLIKGGGDHSIRIEKWFNNKIEDDEIKELVRLFTCHKLETALKMI
jgi:hypothetical protein